MEPEHLKQPLVLVIFGITGDLAQRYLLPALYWLAKSQELPLTFRIVGVSRREVAIQDVYTQLEHFAGDTAFSADIANRLVAQTSMHQMDMTDKSAYVKFLQALQDLEANLGAGVNRLYYLSIPAQVSLPIITLLGLTGHAAPLADNATLPRLLMEKPFGYDITSAKDLITAVDAQFDEKQVYRIDHYLAKETVRNMLTFRFENPLFEAVWNNRHIDHIAILAHEKIGIEGRVNFYEQTGALRDLVQSHLLQLLAITTMDKPATMESAAIHARKLELLEAVSPITEDSVSKKAIRGQYKGYREEVNNSDSTIETYARLDLEIDSERWRGVPIRLETGKALTERRTEIVVSFKQSDAKIDARNKLLFRIKPTEGITLVLQAKQPGITNQTQAVDMDFDYARSFNHRPAEAYEKVISDAIRGDQTLFASAGEVLASWKIIAHVLQEWSKSAEGLQLYESGSAGPSAKPTVE